MCVFLYGGTGLSLITGTLSSLDATVAQFQAHCCLFFFSLEVNWTIYLLLLLQMFLFESVHGQIFIPES